MGDKKVKEKSKGSGVSFKIVLLALLILIVLALSFVGYLLLTRNTPVAVNNNSTVQASVNSASEISPYTYALDEFLVNMSDDGAKKYLKIKLSLGYDTKNKKNMDKELADKKDNIRDSIISVLRSKKSTDLETQTGIDDLKKEILTKINPFFQYGKTNSVYINDILVQ
jgi:flagellar protein FliL